MQEFEFAPNHLENRIAAYLFRLHSTTDRHFVKSVAEMCIRDSGCTVSNNNSKDMLSLYQLSLSLGMEFATAAFHNSYYFHKDDNVITNKDEVCKNFEQLIERCV